MKILHLYPQLMNLYGDYGNLVALKKHLEDLGIEVFIDKKEPGDDLSFEGYDLVYMGSGNESRQITALDDLKKHADELKDYIENDGIVLLTGNAMELAGKNIDDHEALGILDFTVKTTEKRYTGDVILSNDYFDKVVGFINKSTIISNGENCKLFTYVFKDNNLKDNDYEGYRYHNLFGTHVIGPVLVKNPGFMNYIVKLLSKDKYREIEYPDEENAYQVTFRELSKR